MLPPAPVMVSALLLAIALVCFLGATVNAKTKFNVNLCAAGLFFTLLAYVLQAGWVRL